MESFSRINGLFQLYGFEMVSFELLILLRSILFCHCRSCAVGCEDSLIEELHHFCLLGPDQYARYQRFAAEEYVLQEGGVLCPRPGCGHGILPDMDCTRVVCGGASKHGCGVSACSLSIGILEC